MARPQPLSPDDIGKIPEPALFFPNNFRYGVLINIGSGAVPGRLPNDAFREGSGAVPGQGSGGQVRFKEVPGGFRSIVWGKFWAGFQGSSGASSD